MTGQEASEIAPVDRERVLRPLADYLLSNFEPQDDADALVARAADAVEKLDAEGLDRAQAQFN